MIVVFAGFLAFLFCLYFIKIHTSHYSILKLNAQNLC